MKLRVKVFCALLTFMSLYPFTIQSKMVITKQGIIEEIGVPSWTKICKVENGNIYIASSYWVTDTTELKLFILDENLKLKKLRTKSLNKGFHYDIYANDDYIEYYGVINGGDNFDWWYDFHFRIERFDYNFNNIFSHEDTTDNFIRWNVNRFPQRYRRRDGSYVCYDIYILGKLENLGFFATFYDQNGNFLKERMYDTINFFRKINLVQFFGKDERFYHFVRTPKDSLLPKDLYLLKIFSSDFDTLMFVGNVFLVDSISSPKVLTYGDNYLIFESAIFPNIYDSKIVQVDKNGSVLFRKEYSFDTSYGVLYITKWRVLSDGGILFAGKLYNKITKNWALFLWKMNRNFETEDFMIFNEHSYGSTTSFSDIFELRTGIFIVVVRLVDKLWIGFVDGILKSDNSIETPTEKVKVVNLEPNSRIYRFKMKFSTNPQKAKIYNVIGKEVWSSEDFQNKNFYEDGTYNCFIDADLRNLDSGIYFFVAQSNVEKTIEKFVILK